jgi:hypothetical protein
MIKISRAPQRLGAQQIRRLQRLPRALERCRSRHPHPEASQGGIRQAAMIRLRRPAAASSWSHLDFAYHASVVPARPRHAKTRTRTNSRRGCELPPEQRSARSGNSTYIHRSRPDGTGAKEGKQGSKIRLWVAGQVQRAVRHAV